MPAHPETMTIDLPRLKSVVLDRFGVTKPIYGALFETPFGDVWVHMRKTKAFVWMQVAHGGKVMESRWHATQAAVTDDLLRRARKRGPEAVIWLLTEPEPQPQGVAP